MGDRKGDEIIQSIKDEKPDKKLVFFHIPKCAGSYANVILNDLGVKTMEHRRPTGEEDEISFTILRDPIRRYESWLNYILNESEPRTEWPEHLNYVYEDPDIRESITLNEVINEMTDEDILGFKRAYGNLTAWKDVDIFITVDQLHPLLQRFGYDYNVDNYGLVNVSKKTKGTFSDEVIDRLRNLFEEDIEMCNRVLFTSF